MMRLSLGGVAAAILSTAAFAQPAPPTPPGVAQGTTPVATVHPAPQIRTFVHRMPMKTETRDQVAAHVRDMFAKLDGNKDGYVTRDEAKAVHQAMAGGRRDKLTRRFVQQRAGGERDRGAMFDRLDTNRDGSISRQEFMTRRHVPGTPEGPTRVTILQNGREAVEVAGGPGTPGVRAMRFHRSGLAMGMHGRMFDMADANRDGRVSLQEATAAALQHFDQADANRDGRLTPDERTRMRHDHRVRVRRIRA